VEPRPLVVHQVLDASSVLMAMNRKSLPTDTAPFGTSWGSIVRTEAHNPAHRRYAHFLPPSGLYPARHVDIFWNWDNEHKAKDVEVVFIPRDVDLPKNEYYGRQFDHYVMQWDFDLGNSCSDWLQDPLFTPEGVFGVLLRDGFSNETELQRALEEFARIEECEWARNMLRGFND
jgi:hypothetical protein